METFYTQVVGCVIRCHREEKGISILDMAKRLSMKTASGWSRVEIGETTMTLVQLRKASKIFGLKAEEILIQTSLAMVFLRKAGTVVHDEKSKEPGKPIPISWIISTIVANKVQKWRI